MNEMRAFLATRANEMFAVGKKDRIARRPRFEVARVMRTFLERFSIGVSQTGSTIGVRFGFAIVLLAALRTHGRP